MPSDDLVAPALLLGGRLSIDFANIPSYPGAPAQHLSWEELIAFLEASHIVSAERARIRTPHKLSCPVLCAFAMRCEGPLAPR